PGLLRLCLLTCSVYAIWQNIAEDRAIDFMGSVSHQRSRPLTFGQLLAEVLLGVRCRTAAAGMLDHEGQGHEKIREGNHFGVPKIILEESLNLKTDDTRQTPEHQRLAWPGLGPYTCIHRRFPRSEILQQSGIRLHSFCPANRMTCDGKVDRFIL